MLQPLRLQLEFICVPAVWILSTLWLHVIFNYVKETGGQRGGIYADCNRQSKVTFSRERGATSL